MWCNEEDEAYRVLAMVCPLVSVPASHSQHLKPADLSSMRNPSTSKWNSPHHDKERVGASSIKPSQAEIMPEQTIPPMNMALNSACSLSSDNGCPF